MLKVITFSLFLTNPLKALYLRILSNSRKACAKKISETSFSPALKGRSVIMGLKAHASTGMGLRSHASNSRELIRFGHSGSLRDSGYQALSYSTAEGRSTPRTAKASLRWGTRAAVPHERSHAGSAASKEFSMIALSKTGMKPSSVPRLFSSFCFGPLAL